MANFRPICLFNNYSRHQLCYTYLKILNTVKYEKFSTAQPEEILVEDKKSKKIKRTHRKRAETDILEIKQYLQNTINNHSIIDSLPSRFVSKNWFPPEALYIVNPKVASESAEAICKHLLDNNETPVFEMNPGLGLLSQELIKRGVKNLHLFEPSVSFHSKIMTYLEANPKSDVNLRVEDLGNIAKLIYQDKVTNGDRVAQIMSSVTPKQWSDSIPAVKITGTAPNKKFLRNLIFSIAFQSGFIPYGRPEFYLFIHPYNYNQLTSTPDKSYFSYRYNSALFQIMYDHEILLKVPRNDFLPWEKSVPSNDTIRSKMKSFDKDKMYLVKIVGKRDLYDQVPVENIQMLWYFCRINLLSKKKKIIPALEQWIPNCGPRLIRQGITIFTEFGDLGPNQLLQLFQIFTRWPEFSDCAFHTSLEGSFIKSFAAADDDDLDDDDDDSLQPSEKK